MRKGTTVMMRQLRIDTGRLLQALILAGFSALLIKLFWTGEINKLVAPHLKVLLMVTLGVLCVMAVYLVAKIWNDFNVSEQTHSHTCETDCGHNHSHPQRPQKLWAALVLPAALGLAVPTQSLGTAMLESGMYNTPAGKKVDMAMVPKVKVEGVKIPVKPADGSEITTYEVMSNLLIAPENYFNQRYKYNGFVYHPPGWPANRLVLMRYVMVHCAADTLPNGITVELANAGQYADNTWVQVDATLSTRKAPEVDNVTPVAWYYGYEQKPVLEVHSIAQIQEPEEPYLYPFGKILPGGGS